MKVVKGFDIAKSVLARKLTLLEDHEREASVRQILEEVRERGDNALYDYTAKFDGVRLTSLRVPRRDIEEAHKQVKTEVVGALRLASERIRSYHAFQKQSLVRENKRRGLGWKMRPLRRVGVHIPGFSAPLPSSVLMTVVPAKVAGVEEIVIATPPQRDGRVSPVTLVAADISGADEVLSIGGAQALAALAFGTESVAPVDKICGPGNIYVTLAKKLLVGAVGIDSLAGPSEVLIIADLTANPEFSAADYLAQAEHTSGWPVVVATSMDLAERIHVAVKKQMEDLPNRENAAKSVEDKGIICAVDNVDEAIELSNIFGPEHLLLMVEKAEKYLDSITNAGCIVFGDKATVAMGDYVAGPSHVLPTGGTARFASPLSVLDFVKLTSVIDVDDGLLRRLGPSAYTLAKAEGLEAHARALEMRMAK